MLFPTYEFLVFFIITFTLGSFLKQRLIAYKYFLLFVNIIFYSFWSLQFLGLLVIDVIINYLIIQALIKTQRNFFFLILGLLVNLIYLGFFKYYNFFCDSLQGLLETLKIPSDIQILQIITPIGISFYTFRTISHLIDCYRNQLPNPKFLDYAVYITFFPQIASGPIARANGFYQQLNSYQKSEYKIETVIILIISGLFKKYTLSSFLFNFTQIPFKVPDNYTSIDLILAAIAYSCLIYVDFSGYSDLANAISSLLGFQVVQNFNMPYRAQSLQEFWRRWHISLSEWLRDYLYIPLGGSHQGKLRKHFNLLLTMVIGGFWHGAGVNFLIWGLLHGIGLIINHIWKDTINKIQAIYQANIDNYNFQVFRFLGMSKKTFSNKYFLFNLKNFVLMCIPILFGVFTFTYVTLCWIFFTTSNLETALNFLHQIINIDSHTTISSPFNNWRLYAVFIVVFIMNFYGDKINVFLEKILEKNFFLQIVFVSSLLYVIFRLGPNTVPPFIYFNF